MKKTDKMSRAISQLEHIYNTLNTDLFEGNLPVPVITVQSKPGTYGHCSTSKVWRKSDEDTYELNIAAEVLDYPIEETLDTMIHEMIHLYCRENGIKDTSRGGKYHNGRFKIEAEKRGLKCVPCGQYGWNTTAAGNDRLLEYALSKWWNEIRIGRNDVCGIRVGAFGTAQTGMTVSGGKRPSSTRKYVCPCCGMSVRATRFVNIKCMDCDLQMMVQ